jgi:hypothetical protein
VRLVAQAYGLAPVFVREAHRGRWTEIPDSPSLIQRLSGGFFPGDSTTFQGCGVLTHGRVARLVDPGGGCVTEQAEQGWRDCGGGAWPELDRSGPVGVEVGGSADHFGGQGAGAGRGVLLETQLGVGDQGGRDQEHQGWDRQRRVDDVHDGRADPAERVHAAERP